VNDPSDRVVIEMVNETMRAYECAPRSESKLTSPSDVLQAIREFKVDKDRSPNAIPNRALGHLPKRAITFLTKVFNAPLCRQYIPSAWRIATVVSILKPGRDTKLPFSCNTMSLLDTADKLFEKILLTRVLRKVNEHTLLRDEQFGF
jgi:hypothetical protein